MEGALRTRFWALDLFRGVAALWVFVYHYQFSEVVRHTFPSFHAIARIGDLGVPMFFVISGYCLAASFESARRRGESPVSFLHRRFRRIYPPFWISIFAVALIPFVIEAISMANTGNFVNPTPAFLDFSFTDWLALVTLGQAFAPGGNGVDLQSKFAAFNSVYWSLAIEFQFYVVMTVGLWIGRRSRVWFIATTTLGLLAQFVWGREAYASGIFLPYWSMFALGLLVYALSRRGATLAVVVGNRLCAVLAIACAACATGVFVAHIVAGGEISRELFGLGFAFVLWATKPIDAAAERLVATTPVRWLVKPLALLAAYLRTRCIFCTRSCTSSRSRSVDSWPLPSQ